MVRCPVEDDLDAPNADDGSNNADRLAFQDVLSQSCLAEPFAVAPQRVRIIPGYAPHVFSDITPGVSSSWKLVCENVELVNLRRFGKQITGLRFFH